MRTFRSLRHRNYRLYFVGQLVSLVGSWTQITALMWLAHEQTGYARWPAFLAAAQIGPTFLLGPFGGALADRVCKRWLIVRTQFVFLACALAIIGLYLTDLLTIWAMLAVMFVHGIVQAIDLPARLSFVPGLVSRSDLPNAVALNSLLFNVARAIGPAIAALLLGLGGTIWCFILNAASYLAVILALLWIRLPPEEDCPDLPGGGGGFKVLGRTPGLLTLVLLAGMVAGSGWPVLPLLPAFAVKVLGLGEGGYGTLLSAVGIGALAGALLTATFVQETTRRRRLLFAGLLLVAGGLVGLCWTTSLLLSSACCFVFGFGMIVFFATGQSAVQLGTANADRGKVMGVWAMMLSAGVPLGNIAFGPAADAFGVTSVIAVQACFIVAAATWLLFERLE